MIRRLHFAIPLLALLALSAGCASVAKPEGWATPELADDTLYVSLSDGKMSAVDPETYERAWDFPDDDSFACGDGDEEDHDLRGIYGKPAVGDDLVYMGAYDSKVYAVDKEDGSCQWLFDTEDWIVGGLVLADEQLYVPSTDGYLYVLDPATGDEIDRRMVGDVWSAPLLTEEGDLYVGTMDGQLWKFTTGGDQLEEAWDKPFKINTGILTNPVLAAGDTVVIGGIGEKLYGIDAASGEEKWSFAGDNWFWGEPAVDGSTIYATSLGKQVYAIDATSGDEMWSHETESPIRGGAVAAVGTVVAVDDSGIVNLLDAETGDLVQSVELDRSVYATPLAVENAVLVLTRSGKVFSIDLETARVTEVVD